MRHLIGLTLVLLVTWGCGSKASPNITGPSQSAEGTRHVTASLTNRFLYDHNASFSGAKTSRWLPPIPIYTETGIAELDRFLLGQFLPWEGALAGAGGTPFYAPQGMTRGVPRRGIFFALADLPEPGLAAANPFVTFAERRRLAAARRQLVPELTPPPSARHVEAPEILASGEIQRCVIGLDPTLEFVDDTTFGLIIRHEVGHCLGFYGHVASGLMRPTCCAPAITSDVTAMLRTLYTLPPGTPVTP